MNGDKNSSSLDAKFLLGTLWVISLLIVGYLGFIYGKGSSAQQSKTTQEKTVLQATNQALNIQTPTPSESSLEKNALPVSTENVTPTAVIENTCSKNGFAQKWEYLTSYTIKGGDSLQSIAADQLKDATRADEILKINGVGSLVVGSTLYLPPSSITKSSGNIKQVYGKLVEKNSVSWHLSFTAGTTGQGILIPAYLFDSVPNVSTYKIGDCLSILLDDGYKIYSLTLQ
jgi:hypothetical protein